MRSMYLQLKYLLYFNITGILHQYYVNVMGLFMLDSFEVIYIFCIYSECILGIYFTKKCVVKLTLSKEIFQDLATMFKNLTLDSCLSEVLDKVINRFLIQKNANDLNFQVILTLISGFTTKFSFFEKNLTVVISVSRFDSCCFTENLSPPTASKISTCGFLHSTHN